MCQYKIIAFSLLLLWMPLNSWSHGDVHQRIDALSLKITHEAEVGLLLKRALLFRDDGDLAKAWSDYKQVLSHDPVNPNALYLGAKTALGLGSIREAKSLAKRFTSIALKLPNKAVHARAYQLMADICLVDNNRDKALSYYKKSMVLQSQPTPDSWLGLADLRLQQEGYTQALETLKQALLQSGVNVSIHQKIVELAVAQKDYRTALYYLERQLEKSASLREVILLAEKAQVLVLAADNEQASVIKKKALQAFKKLPGNRKNQPEAKSINRYLFLDAN